MKLCHGWMTEVWCHWLVNCPLNRFGVRFIKGMVRQLENAPSFYRLLGCINHIIQTQACPPDYRASSNANFSIKSSLLHGLRNNSNAFFLLFDNNKNLSRCPVFLTSPQRSKCEFALFFFFLVTQSRYYVCVHDYVDVHLFTCHNNKTATTT